MKRFFGQSNLIKSKIEILSPFNTIVLPDIIYTTRVTKPQEEMLKKLKVEKIISTIFFESEVLKKQNEQINQIIEQARQESQKINEILQEKKTKKKIRNKMMYDHNLVSLQKDYFLFDPEFRRLINNRYFNQDNDYCYDEQIIKKFDEFYLNEKDTYGSLNQISFHKFQMDHQNTQMIHSFGMRPVKIIEEQDLSEVMFKEWVFSKYDDFIQKTQTKIDGLKQNETDDKKKQQLLKTLERYKNRIDENNEEYLFQDIGLLMQQMKDRKFKLVSYENHFTVEDAVYNLSQEEFDKCKEIAIQINGFIRALMVKSNFILYDKFLDLNNLATEKYFIHWYHNLVGIMCSKKVINEAGIIYLNKETNLLEKLNFLKIVIKDFQIQYIKQWVNIEEEIHKKKNFNPKEEKQSIKEMYEQYKEFAQNQFSSTKKEIIKKVEDFLEKRKLNKKVYQVIKEELIRFKDLNEQESDYQNTKNYLDLITKLPFDIQTSDQTDLKKAKKILEESHFGMEDVKTRILEYLAIGKLKENFVSNKVLCLLGPPGVGKTSIAKSIAECLGRKFQRIALGGENDVSVLKGHRRTYLGAYPGKILNALKLAESENPVILLDEIDKIGRSSHKGNVQDVLLEILDPMQNSEFNDHYLEAPLDLSKVLFLCSANILDSSTISSALYDRLEVIELSGYTQEEKLKIFHEYLLKKLLKKVGLDQYNINLTFPDDVISDITDKYARESGVRSLEKKVQIILEKFILDFLQQNEDFEEYAKDKSKTLEHKFTKEEIQKYLGPRIFHSSTIIHQDDDQIGYALGLGYSSIGGSVLSIEVIELPEKLKDIKIETQDDKENPQQKQGSIQITGSLGTIMKESVEIAYSFAKNFLQKIDNNNHLLEDKNLHIHFPEGASKKDGPSAGITITSAILSLALKKKFKNNFAMTGEISLNGKVMKIGGLREKVLAAKRENIDNIIVPKSNKGDIKKLKDYIKTGLTFHYVENYQQVYDLLFAENQLIQQTQK